MESGRCASVERKEKKEWAGEAAAAAADGVIV